MFGEVILMNCDSYTRHIGILYAQYVGFLNGDRLLYVHVVTAGF